MDDATDAVLLVSRALVGLAARSLATTEGQITLPRLCDRLVEKRLIERLTSGEGRREVKLALSESGRALVGAETEPRRRAIREIVRRIEPPTQAAIVDALNALAAALRRCLPLHRPRQVPPCRCARAGRRLYGTSIDETSDRRGNTEPGESKSASTRGTKRIGANTSIVFAGEVQALA